MFLLRGDTNFSNGFKKNLLGETLLKNFSHSRHSTFSSP